MLKKSFIFLTIIFAIGTFSVVGQTKTVVKDSKAKKMLLGKHKLSLQWIDFYKYFGVATITEKKGVLYLKGEQKQKGEKDFLKIDGTISRIEAKSFTFTGKIETRVSHINNGEVCVRDGEMIFRITGKRKYWRLMQMNNPCDEVTDYVDIFFR